MKKIAYILIAALTVFACAKEEINHPSEANAPKTRKRTTKARSTAKKTTKSK